MTTGMFRDTPPEFLKLLAEVQKSPESYGAWVFNNFWSRFTKSDLPFDSERTVLLEHPIFGRVMEREYLDFKKARKALELKSEVNEKDNTND